MKKILILAGFIFAASAANVFASEYEDFESYEIDTLPINWTSGYNIGEYGTKIAADPTDDSNKTIKITANAARTQAVYYLSESYSGKVTVEYDMYISDTDSLQHTPCPANNSSDVLGTMMQESKMIYGGGSSLKYIAGFTYDTWHHVKIELDTGSLKYDFYLDDKLQVSERNMGNAAMFGIDSIITVAESTDIYIDNIKVEKMGESTDVKYLFYSTEYTVNRIDYTIGDINFGKSIDDVLRTLKTAEGVALTVESDVITAQLGDRSEKYTVLKRKNPITKSTENVIKNSVIIKIGTGNVLDGGMSKTSDKSVSVNSKGEVEIPLGILEQFYIVSYSWNEEKFGTLFEFNGNSVFKKAKYKVGALNGYRIKVLPVSVDEYEENLSLTVSEIKQLGIDIRVFGNYIFLPKNEMSNVAIKSSLADIKRVF